MSEEELRTALLRRGWRQGSVVPTSLLESIRFADEHARLPEDAVAVVASQDCDVLATKPQDEPVIEVVAGRHIAVPDSRNLHAKSPRRIDVTIVEADQPPRFVALEMRFRGSLQRGLLAQSGPAGTVAEGEQRSFSGWLARRYDRPALPDSFNTRLNDRKAKLRNLLKKSAPSQPLAILVSLGEQATLELSRAEPYRIGIVVVMQGKFQAGDPEWDHFERNVYDPLVEQFESIFGIEVTTSLLLAEDQISWYDRRRLSAIDLDDLSFRHGEDGDTPEDR